ncbi:MAG: hypothetical protein WBF48_07115 [Halarcobacter sp.]
MKALKLLTISFCVLGATILAADILPARGPLQFSTYDKDNNGAITSKEFDAIKVQRINQKVESGKLMRNVNNSANFSDIDVNNDGKVTPLELTTYQEKRYADKLNQRNTNKKSMGQGQGQKGQGQKQKGQGQGNKW